MRPTKTTTQFVKPATAHPALEESTVYAKLALVEATLMQMELAQAAQLIKFSLTESASVGQGSPTTLLRFARHVSRFQEHF